MLLNSKFRIRIIRSAYLSLRFRGQIFVLRGTRVGLGRGASIRVARGCRVVIGEHYGGGPASLELKDNARISFHGQGRVSIARGARLLVLPDAHLEIGAGTTINFNATITCFEHIMIAEDAGISWDVNIVDGNGHTLMLAGVSRPPTRPTSIGRHAWIGIGVTVLGAVVGDGALVAAGSMVISDVPDDVAVAGSPARVIGKGVAWDF